MTFRRASTGLTGLLIALAVGLAGMPGPGHAATSSGQAGGAQVLARVDGTSITRAELDKKARGELLTARYRYYLAERQALNQAIDDRLLELQAKAEGVTVDQLLKRHVENQVKTPSEETLRVYYLGIETDKPFAQIKSGIIEHIRTLEEQKARQAFIAKLRADHHIAIAMLPPQADVALGDAPVEGPQNAKITLIEFADYQCPYCREMQPSLRKLQEEFPTQLRFAFKDFPLPMHQYAEKAAEAAHCAGEQGQFWKYHTALYNTDVSGLAVPGLKKIAAHLGLNAESFDKCLDSGSTEAAISKDKQQGEDLGLTGTPSFFINGHFVSGAVGYDTLRQVVEAELNADSGYQTSANAHPHSALSTAEAK